MCAFLQGRHASRRIEDLLVASAMALDVGTAFDAWESAKFDAWLSTPDRAVNYSDFCTWVRLVCECESVDELVQLVVDDPRSVDFVQEAREFLIGNVRSGFTPLAAQDS